MRLSGIFVERFGTGSFGAVSVWGCSGRGSESWETARGLLRVRSNVVSPKVVSPKVAESKNDRATTFMKRTSAMGTAVEDTTASIKP